MPCASGHWEDFSGGFPCSHPSTKVPHKLRHICKWQPDLRHRVPLSEGHRGVFERSMVKRHPERYAQLIIPRVASADGGAAFVDGVGQAQRSKLRPEAAEHPIVTVMPTNALIQWQNGALVRRNVGREGQDTTRLLVFRLIILGPGIVYV